MIDADDSAPYDRPNLSKYYLAGEAEPEWIPLRPTGFYQEHGITVLRSNVARLDVHGRTVHLTDGSSHRYDALLLATGAEPRTLDIPGHDQASVHVTPADVAKVVRVSSDLGQHAAWIDEYAALGFDEIYLHQVGEDQRSFLDAFGEHVLPQLGVTAPEPAVAL